MDEEQEKRPKINPSMHAALLALVGGYMVYIAYQIFNKGGAADGMSMPLAILFTVFFALAGVSVIAYAVRLWLKDRQEQKQNASATSLSSETPSVKDDDDAHDKA